MHEHLDNRKRASYCYSVHTDNKNNHAHIAVTGSDSDLWTGKEDLDRMREIGAETTREEERDRSTEAERARGTRAQTEQERERTMTDGGTVADEGAENDV